jgi:peptidoglycan/xylan/chitin deacetylase (PgdA/CDA1 family)
VFAELKAPDIVAAPEAREVVAVMVRTVQKVRVWGEWRTVRHVRSDQYTAGGPAVVLEFDDGPALRVHAAEPLAVRVGDPCG